MARGDLTPQEVELRNTISVNINRALKERKAKQIDIHNATGIPKSTITGYVKGTSIPIAGNVQKLADFFGIKKSDIDPRYSASYELTENVSSAKQKLNEVFDELKEKRRLKVVDYAKNELKEQKQSDSKVKDIADYIASRDYNFYDDAVSAGTGQFIGDSQKEQVTLPVDYEADFVVPVYGNSMEPEYHDGDYIFVKLSVDLSDGDIGVFELYGDTYVKQLVIEDDHAYLHSLNKKYKDMLVDADSDFRTIGKVVGRFA